MKGTKPQLISASGALTKAPRVPEWLSTEAKAEWRRVMPDLIDRRILHTSDLASLENYCVVVGRARQIEREIQTGGTIDVKLFRAQNQVLITARQLAAELGLTPVSRSRPVLRDKEQDAADLAFLD